MPRQLSSAEWRHVRVTSRGCIAGEKSARKCKGNSSRSCHNAVMQSAAAGCEATRPTLPQSTQSITVCVPSLTSSALRVGMRFRHPPLLQRRCCCCGCLRHRRRHYGWFTARDAAQLSHRSSSRSPCRVSAVDKVVKFYCRRRNARQLGRMSDVRNSASAQLYTLCLKKHPRHF